LFVIVLPQWVISGSVSSLKWGGVANQIPVQVFLQQCPHATLE
jgi:hypothetical protein